MIIPFLKRFERQPEASAETGGKGPEHRVAVRHETEIEASLSLRGRDHPCTIRNISTRGMTVAATGIALGVGAQVVVRCPAEPALCGTIRWIRDGVFGIQLVRQLALEQIHNMRTQVPEGMKARAGRARLRMPAKARFANQTRRIEVLNVSIGGLQMATGLPPREGLPVMIEFADLPPIGGHIRWSRAGRAGVMFSRLLPLRVAEELARRESLPVGWLDEVRMVHEFARAA